MTDEQKARLAEIKRCEQAATPGPWVFPGGETFPDVIWGDCANLDGHGPEICRMPELDDRPADFEFIANSRSDVAWLLALVEEQAREIDDYHTLIEMQRRATLAADRLYQQAHGWPETAFPGLHRLVDWLVDDNARLRAALEQYADHGNWHTLRDQPVMWVGGTYGWVVAEAALAAQDGE